jgi:hypothetical protein
VRRLFLCAVLALMSGGVAFVAAAAAGFVAAFATPFVAGFPAPDPPDSTDYGRGMLMGWVGLLVFAIVLVPAWIAGFTYLWRRCDADAFIEGRIGLRNPRDA